MDRLDQQLRKLEKIFEQKDRYKAHQEAENVLIEMAKDSSYLEEVIKRVLLSPGYFSKPRINPVLAFPIIENANFSMIAHAFIPRPDGNSDLTHQSIHHHGNLLLSTVNTFGKGYESILFKPGYAISETEAQLSVDKKYVNTLYNYEFIGPKTPHVVYYPDSVCITFALWSTEKKIAADGLKKIGFLKKYKNQLRNGLLKLGFGKMMNLNRIEYVDFYPENGKVIPMKNRVRYPEGSNESLIHNTFHLLQEIEFSDEKFIHDLVSHLPPEEKQRIKTVSESYLTGEKIERSLDPIHEHLDKVNISRTELELAFPETK